MEWSKQPKVLSKMVFNSNMCTSDIEDSGHKVPSEGQSVGDFSPECNCIV